MEIDQKHPYHSISIEETLDKLSAEDEGLSTDEAEKRQKEFGKNVLPQKGGTSPVMLFLKQFKDFLILILFIAAGVAFWADKMTDVYIILAVILFNAIMGFTQEYKAEKAIQSIKSLEQKNAYVLRDGKEKEIPAENVVPGDIMVLKEGGTVPADGRLLHAKELRSSEASLTGESMPIDKKIEPTDEDAPIGDRINMVWKSTNVVNGSGKAVVTAIGNKTEIGKIAKSMGEMEMQDSNFRKKTGLLGKQMAGIAIVSSAIVFSLGYWMRNYDFQEILLVTIAVLVSAIPEGLPAVISIVLAIGANRMAKQNVIIREFTATEMMGSVSVILADKTGTLTQSILVIKKIFTASGKELEVSGTGYQLQGKFKEDGQELNLDESPVERKLLAIAAFCNDAHLKEGQNEEKDSESSKKTASSKKEDKPSDKENQEDQKNKEEEKEVSSKEKDQRKPQPSKHLNVTYTKKKEDVNENIGKKDSEKDEEHRKQKTSQQEINEKGNDEKLEKDKNIEVDVDVKPDNIKINIKLRTEDKNNKTEEGQEIEEGENEEGEENEEEKENKEGEEKKVVNENENGEEEESEENVEGEEEEDQGPQIVGDPTEAAMFVVGEKAKIKKTDPFNSYKIIDEVPFKSEQKFRASLVETEEGAEIFAIGAPERILELSNEYLTPKGPKKLGDDKRQEIQDKMDEYAEQAMRVLALGFKEAEGKDALSPDDVEDLIWVGITGIIDPPRKRVRESIQECKTAGIRVIMVTGDHKKTAAAIAEKVGILDSKDKKEGNKYPASITTKELDVEDEKFDEYLQNVNVFARMNPDTKLRIAERLQAKDTLISMTGDGVNDAPALKRADVGISMGQRGTDVAKDASEIVLQDDNFSSIVNAIREGRIVFNNVKIASYFLLTTNFAFVLAFILNISIGWPLLFTAAQILYINLVTDGIMDVALATEPGHGDIMKQPPVKKSEKILKWDVVPYLVVVSIVMVTLTLLIFWYYLPQGEVMARTAAFIIVSSTQLFNAYNMRSLRLSIFEIGPFTNKWINLAFLAAIGLQFAVVKLPFLIDLLGFTDFPVLDFLIMIAISSLIVWVSELYKFLKFKKNFF